MSVELALAALNMAFQRRRARGGTRHSDRCSQYTSVAVGERRQMMAVLPSMGSVGDAYWNAMAERFFARLEYELIDQRSWKTKNEARLALFTYIDNWYASPALFRTRSPIAGDSRAIPVIDPTGKKTGKGTRLCYPALRRGLTRAVHAVGHAVPMPTNT